MFPINAITPSLPAALGLFAVCTLVIGVVGPRLTRVVDQLADRTGIGEAIAGAVFLGASTSLSGIVLSVTAAWRAHPELATSNALGGIAGQTLFLAVADMLYRRANLEHAAASITNIMQGGMLLCLLSLVLLACYAPDITIWQIHPATPLLFLTYGYGLMLVRRVRSQPMWEPARTEETFADEQQTPARQTRLSGLWLRFLLLALMIGFAGWLLETAASTVADKSQLNQTVVGVFLTALCTSLPELVTAIAAIRRGALTLAIGGIIGGNAFDTLFIAASDIAYRKGSIYHTITDQGLLWTALTLTMTSILLLGLVYRERHGFGGIGFESAIIIAVYGLGVLMMLI